MLGEPRTPFAHRVLTDVEVISDVCIGIAVSSSQHDTCSLHQSLFGTPGVDDGAKTSNRFFVETDHKGACALGQGITLRKQAPRRHAMQACSTIGGPERKNVGMAKPPESTKTNVRYYLKQRARECWPQITALDVRFRANFAYVTAETDEGESLPLCRLRYGGSASTWGFAVYLASKDKYEDSILPNGQFAGSPQDALDCACGLYFGDPSAWR